MVDKPTTPPPNSGEPVTEVFERPSLSQREWLLRALRDETVGGVLLLIAAVAALICANSALSDWYFDLASTEIGPVINLGPIHLDLNLSIANVALPSIGGFGLWAMGIFLAILVVGFVYEWKKGALEWD